MDYEKKYKDALERAKELIALLDKVKLQVTQADIYEIFPELLPGLRESEDERWRKETISIVKEYGRICEKEGDPCCTINDCLAYLEKQKEQKPVEVKDPFSNANFVRGYESGYNDAIREQKPAATINGEPIPIENHSVDIPLAEWSEEDERMLSRCIKSIECSKMFAEAKTFKDAKDNEINWLKNRFKSLRPQPKQEWSEEDKKTIRDAIDILNYEGYKTNAEALKSLRPSWKPSEEQMEALEYVIRDYREDSCNATANYLREILDHLKNM